MRQETNNEIDLLLRRLGRRPDGGVSDPGGGHLDADELSSYAENALPPAARARYSEHLVQCSSCRTLVVQLSSAAGVAVAPERSAVPALSGFRKFLANLLSPLVLRYAIPALGLALIAVIGLTVFRPEQKSETDLAQRGSAPAPPNEQLNTPVDGSAAGNRIEPSKSAPATPDTRDLNMSKEPATAPAATDRISAPVGEANAARAEEAPPPPKPAVQPITNTQAPAPTPVATAADERKSADLEKEAQQQLQAARESQTENAFMHQRDEGRGAKTQAAPTTASATKKKEEFSAAPQAGAGAALRRADKTAKDSDDSEIRTVAGRRFRKQQGVWVDTAYSSSSATVNLTRGSEQFRALVADEPGIKNIADQLDGEIIVVWKGRPYRIR